MAGLNGTGPAGRGSGTGRRLGICSSARPRPGGFYRRATAAIPDNYHRRTGFMNSRRRAVNGFHKQGE